MSTHRRLYHVLSILVVLIMLFSGVSLPAASAQGPDGIERQVNPQTGKVSFLGPENGQALSASNTLGMPMRPQDPAMALAKRFGPEFGLKNPERELSQIKTSRADNGRITARYQQNYQGIPVMGGELIVNTNRNGDLYSMNGEVSSALSLSTQPTISAEQAKQTALQAVAKWYQKTSADFTASEPALWIFDESLLRTSTRQPELVWRMEVAAKDVGMPVRELVLVNSHRGHISLHFNQLDTAWTAPVSSTSARYSSNNFDDHTLQAGNWPIYFELVIDEPRGWIYGSDSEGDKVDVISMTTLQLVKSFTLVDGAAPKGIALSPSGNELAIAQSGASSILFLNLTNSSTIATIVPNVDSGLNVPWDVVYGRPGRLYSSGNPSSYGFDYIHVINTTTHTEVSRSGYIIRESPHLTISADKNYLFANDSGDLSRFNISTDTIPTPVWTPSGINSNGTYILLPDESKFFVDSKQVWSGDLKARIGWISPSGIPAILPGHDAIAVSVDKGDNDEVHFVSTNTFHTISKYQLPALGTMGPLIATSDGSKLYMNSSNGLTRINLTSNLPGDPVPLPSGSLPYFDTVFDETRGVIYGSNSNGHRIDVISANTLQRIKSFQLVNGSQPKGMALSPDGSELAVAQYGASSILFLDPDTGETIATVIPSTNSENFPWDVIYGRPGRLYSSGSPYSSGIDYIHIFDTTTRAEISRSFHSVRFSPQLAISSDNNRVFANDDGVSPEKLYKFDVSTDVYPIASPSSTPHTSQFAADTYLLSKDNSKIFTSRGQVWSNPPDLSASTQIGSFNAQGYLVENPSLSRIAVLSNPGLIKFVKSTDYSIASTFSMPSVLSVGPSVVNTDENKLFVNTNAGMKLVNLNAALPSLLAYVSGSNQTTAPNNPFPQTLQVKVQNYLQQPLAGQTITFTAPASGASGIFANTRTNVSTAVTNANGIATSSVFWANGVTGNYVVTASLTGFPGSVTFSLFNSTQRVKTYTANNETSLPGTLLCQQTQLACTNGSIPHADFAHKYTIGTYNLYAIQHQRNSIDNMNMVVTSTVHYKMGYGNAFWNGTQMVYGDAYGFPRADDVVAHELTHGVTDYESNLFYYYQSGAINESFSDLWGEYYDQTNSQGNDGVGVKWQMGEDVSGLGTLRDMRNPSYFSDPDRMSSPYYYMGEDDNGGVHTNSGINNKAIFLMVDGGSFNGKTVNALGWTKTAAIYYEVNSKILTSGSDYSDLYFALQKSCQNLIGQKGITAGDCAEVKDAIDAVEMNSQPTPNFNPDAPVCAEGSIPSFYFTDNLESGMGNWSISNGTYRRWQLNSPYGLYAQSGIYSLYADDYPAAITDATAKLKSLTIPSNAYLHFAHAYDFEQYQGVFYDGGVLEYSINNGSTWINAAPLIDVNGYSGGIYPNWNNPLKGRMAFVGSSHGYVSTRLNLASLAGKNVTFRWRMGLDDSGLSWGWWVDNIKLYTCTPPPGAFYKTSPSNGSTGASLNPTISWSSSSYASSYQYCYDIIDDNQCNRPWSSTSSTSVEVANLGTNTTYYWQVRALNAVGTTYSDSQSWGSFTTTSTLPAGVTDIETFIGTNQQGMYSLGSGQSLRENYRGVNNGPVKLGSTSSTPLNSAERLIYKVGGVNTSFSEMMGLPANQLDTTYWLPWYNNKDLDTQLRIANVTDQPATVTVTIGGVPKEPIQLAAGESIRVSYAGVNAGPVKIESDQNIVAAERLIYKVGGIATSFSETMAVPSSQLDTTYWLPWYNNKDLDTQLRIANTTDNPATVTVTIGGVEMDPLNLAAGESTRVSYPSINNGPVKIVSDQQIVAAERIIYKVNDVNTSFSEMMALPASQLDNTYWLPWYNNKDLDTQLRFANTTDTPASVHIYIGGVEMINSPFTLEPGESTRQSFPHINNGPVQIVSDQDIVVSERLIYKVNGVNTSFSEMMALPNLQLDTTYWFPWYNNKDLDTQLRFGVP